MREKIKQVLIRYPCIWAVYKSIKGKLVNFFMLRYFWVDISKAYHFMYWYRKAQPEKQLSAELLFQYHKIEKGLVMPGKKRFFGVEPAKRVIELLEQWDFRGLPDNSPIRIGAIETLRSYFNCLVLNNLDEKNNIIPELRKFLDSHPTPTESYSTPRVLNNNLHNFGGIESFIALVEARRSVRAFDQNKSTFDQINKAVELAQQSPSACNRQPCKVYMINDAEKKNKILSLQNGNRGFGHLIPTVVVITSDTAVFFDPSERHEPYVDAGLFSMSFMYALTAQGLATCCLNWCVSPAIDNELRKLVPVSSSECVIMLMAVGFPEDCVAVPRSPRRALSDVLVEVL